MEETGLTLGESNKTKARKGGLRSIFAKAGTAFSPELSRHLSAEHTGYSQQEQAGY